MADITKCKDSDCPKRLSCYRYMALDSFRQSFFMKTPRDILTGVCNQYIKMDEHNYEL